MTNGEAIKVLQDWDEGCTDCHCEIHTDRVSEAINVAVSAIEKQTPTKAIHVKSLLYYGLCPNCKEAILFKFEQCLMCGQRLDWSVEDGD